MYVHVNVLVSRKYVLYTWQQSCPKANTSWTSDNILLKCFTVAISFLKHWSSPDNTATSPSTALPPTLQFLFLFFFLLQVSLHAFPGQLLLSLVSFRVAPKPLPVSPAFLPALVLLHPPATQHCNQSKASLSVSARRRPITQSNKVAFMTI